MYDLAAFGFAEMLNAGGQLRTIAAGATSFESAAQRVAEFFYDRFTVPADECPAFVLARCFKTHALGLLPAELQDYARGLFAGVPPTAETRCLTLLGTAGDRPEWRSRHTSVGHKAIPLTSEEVVRSLPMVSRLTKSLGLDAHALVRPDPQMLLEHEKAGFNVFYVPDAQGAAYVPAQDWVRSSGVRSVVGFGAVMPPADILAVILFARVPVQQETAEQFKALALSLKLAFLPLASRPLFD